MLRKLTVPARRSGARARAGAARHGRPREEARSRTTLSAHAVCMQAVAQSAQTFHQQQVARARRSTPSARLRRRRSRRREGRAPGVPPAAPESDGRRAEGVPRPAEGCREGVPRRSGPRRSRRSTPSRSAAAQGVPHPAGGREEGLLTAHRSHAPSEPPSARGSGVAVGSEPAGQRAQPDQRHLPDRLEHDRAVHLRGAVLAVGERDRDLDDAEAGAAHAVRRLDLERVALRVDRVERDRLEHAAAEALEAAGQVADAALEEDLRVDVPAERDEPAQQRPSSGSSRRARSASRARGRRRPRPPRSAAARPSGRARSRSPSRARARRRRRARAGSRRGTRARALPCRRGAARRPSVLGREPVGELAGAVGRGVVDHEHAVALRAAPRRARGSSPRGSRARCRSAGRSWRASRRAQSRGNPRVSSAP